MNGNKKLGLRVLVIAFAFALIGSVLAIDPSAPNTFSYVTNRTAGGGDGTQRDDTRGYIHIVNLDKEQQTPRWKGYIGNITGSLILGDSSGNALYDWTMTSITGEVYATRKTATVTWSSLVAVTQAQLQTEDSALSFTAAMIDRINATFTNYTNSSTGFNNTAFYAGETSISENATFGRWLNVNDARQYSKFEEIVLHDGSNVVYATILESNENGFDNNLYDFQLMVPENASSGSTTAISYDFYIELL